MTDINKSYKEVNLQSASTFRIWSIADLEQEPEPEWLIEPFLMVDSQAVLFGAPGDGKSFVALSFALCVASGRKWLGHEVKQGPVLYVAAEGGRGMKKRVRAWLKANGMHDVPEMFFLREAPQLREPNDLKKLQKTIDQPQKPVLIVLDTVARTMVGAEENSAKDVGEWIDAAQKLQQGSGATVLSLHHTVKRAGKGKGPAERGSSALRGAMDTMMMVVKKLNIITLSCEKQKDEEEFKDILLFAKQVEIGLGRNGPEKSLVVVRADASEEPVLTPLSGNATIALRSLTGLAGPLVRKREWKAAVDADMCKVTADRSFMNWVDELMNAGEVIRVTRGVYALKNQGNANATEMPCAATDKAA